MSKRAVFLIAAGAAIAVLVAIGVLSLGKGRQQAATSSTQPTRTLATPLPSRQGSPMGTSQDVTVTASSGNSPRGNPGGNPQVAQGGNQPVAQGGAASLVTDSSRKLEQVPS